MTPVPKPPASKPPAPAKPPFPPLRLAGPDAATPGAAAQHNGASASAAGTDVRPPPTAETIRAARPYLTEIAALPPLEAARAYRQLEAPPTPDGRVAVDLRSQCYELPATVADVLRPAARARKEHAFAAFAASRAPLQDAMVATTTGGDRHAAAQTLRAHDAPRLAVLRGMLHELGGVWDIDADASRKAVVAALQLEAATSALSDLPRDANTVHQRVARAAGHALNEEWCGMFVADAFVRASLDEDLRSGFVHVMNVEDYFRYNYNRNDERVRPWIWVDGRWQALRPYHASRGSERSWMGQAKVQQGGNLDILPGDIAIIDNDAKGVANHIVMVASYDPATSRLVTIGGNDHGYVLGTPSAGTLKAESSERRILREEGESTVGQSLKPGSGAAVAVKSLAVTPAPGAKLGHVFGIGRPSIVDFEPHRYPTANAMKKLTDRTPPPPLKA
jgi:hypothetical protein